MSDAAFAPLTFAPVAAERADETAVARGHAAGYAAGLRAAQSEFAARRAEFEAAATAELAAARARLDSLAAALGDAAERMRRSSAPVLEQADAALAAAAVELAAAILGREPDPTSVDVLERALAIAGDEVPRRVRLAPADAAVAADLAPAGVDLVADPAVESGSALIDLPHGEIDARIAASLVRARAALGRDATGEESR